MGKYLDITGKKYGRLTAKEFSYREGTMYFWTFVCDCGTEKILLKPSVLRGHTRSCGCYNNEERSKRFTKHGYAKDNEQHPMYKRWASMRSRCYDKNSVGYHRYGGRGITICDRWSDFDNFLKDMESSWKKHLKKYGAKQTSLDRIDNNGNYEPLNCRWATWKEQANNKDSGWILRREKMKLNEI
jgi:hypothetical protein